MSALFTADGTMTESEVDIAVSALPASVLNYVKTHYKGAAIKEGAKITKADGTVNYEAEVNKMDVLFDEWLGCSKKFTGQNDDRGGPITDRFILSPTYLNHTLSRRMLHSYLP